MVSESVCSSSCVSSAKGTRRPDHSSSSFAAESSTHCITQRGIPTVDIPTLSPAPVVSQDASRITSPYLCGDSPDKCQASRHLPPQQLGLTSGQVTMTMAQKTVQQTLPAPPPPPPPPPPMPTEAPPAQRRVSRRANSIHQRPDVSDGAGVAAGHRSAGAFNGQLSRPLSLLDELRRKQAARGLSLRDKDALTEASPASNSGAGAARKDSQAAPVLSPTGRQSRSHRQQQAGGDEPALAQESKGFLAAALRSKFHTVNTSDSLSSSRVNGSIWDDD